MDQVKLYREMTEAVGPPGFEDDVRAIMRTYLEPYVDKLETDRIGSLIARKEGLENGPKIMLGAHMDEVGYMATRITEEGYLKFQPLGGWSEQVMLAQQVTVLTRNGRLHGVIGSKPSHLVSQELRKQTIPISDMFIDIGVSGRQEAEEAGVRPGDFIVPICPFTIMHNPSYLLAKAWDNRFGCIILIEVMKRLSGESHPNIVYAVGTVQEEVGLRGAVTSVNTVKPDIAIAIDSCLAGDTPNINAEESTARLGGGPVIGLLDKSMIAHKALKELILDTAADEGIPIQYDFMTKGSTDAGSFMLHDQGVPTLYLGAATRYIHSAAGILHRNDLERTVDLLTALLHRLDRTTVNTILTY